MALLWGRLWGVGALQVLADPAVGLLMLLRRGKTWRRGEPRGSRHKPLALEEDGLAGLPLRLSSSCAGTGTRGAWAWGWGRRPGGLLLCGVV